MLRNVEHMLQAFMYIRKIYVNEFNACFKEDNYSPNEIDILLFLHNNPSINTSMQLCVCLNVSKTLVSRSIDSLIKKQLLISKTDEEDKRIQRLSITENAQPFIMKIESLRNKINQEILKDITKEELIQMETTLNKIKLGFEKKAKGDSL